MLLGGDKYYIIVTGEIQRLKSTQEYNYNNKLCDLLYLKYLLNIYQTEV